VQANSLQELIALAKKEKLAYASSGIGTTTHLSMERIKDRDRRRHHPRALSAGAGCDRRRLGQTQISSTSMPPAVPQIKAGKLRPIAVTSAQPLCGAPRRSDGERAGLQGFRRPDLGSGFFCPRARAPASSTA